MGEMMVPEYYIVEICREESRILRRRGEFYEAVNAAVLCTNETDEEPHVKFGYFCKHEWEQAKANGGRVREIPLVGSPGSGFIFEKPYSR